MFEKITLISGTVVFSVLTAVFGQIFIIPMVLFALFTAFFLLFVTWHRLVSPLSKFEKRLADVEKTVSRLSTSLLIKD